MGLKQRKRIVKCVRCGATGELGPNEPTLKPPVMCWKCASGGSLKADGGYVRRRRR